MAVVLITGSGGLVGSEAAAHHAARGFDVVGIDNDRRRRFFGDSASTEWARRGLEQQHPGYRHHDIDIRDRQAVEALVQRLGRDIALIVHAAAQPSHDWAARDPHTDFGVNAVGTLTLLEAARFDLPSLLNDIYARNAERWQA
jgi:CDP-paratose 2-epimerase